MSNIKPRLEAVRILAAINGTELFGHERANIEVLKTLRSEGAEIRVGVNASPDNQVADQLDKLGIAIFPLPFGAQWSIQWVLKHPTYAFTNVLSILRCSRLFAREIRTFRPTHIHIGSPIVYSFISVALAFTRLPVIYRMGDSPPVDSPFNLRIWRRAMRRTTRLVVNSDFVRRSVLAVIPDGNRPGWMSAIYNLPPATMTTSDRIEEVQPLRRQSLLYVGAISRHKGLMDLVQAFGQLAANFPDANLDIVGGSRYDRKFREELLVEIDRLNLADRVFLHGQINDPSNFFRQAQIHVAPSLWDEPAANVVVEAKRESVPSVVYPSGGLPEYVNHKVDGFICSERSVSALAEAIRWMLEDDIRLKQMKNAAKKDLDDRFGAVRFADDWVGVYLSVAD